MKTICLTVTNDICYDQRMRRICRSLAQNGYKVVLVGRLLKHSPPLNPEPYQQTRLQCYFNAGKMFYLEFNWRLFLHLLVKKIDVLCAVDLDTILPCYFISKLKRCKRVYDAHELFCEMQEIVTRPGIYRIWKWIERKTVPKFRHGYTVNQPIAAEFNRMYGVTYDVIRNIAVLERSVNRVEKHKAFILYQGAVNEGRSFETLIPAMEWIEKPLIICGEGNFMEQARKLVRQHKLDDQVIFKGRIVPDELKVITGSAALGITLFEKKGLSNYYSLANRFFDYMHAGIPQICVDYPVYRELNRQFEVALLIEDLSSQNIAKAINQLLSDEVLYRRLQQNCLLAREVFNWQEEEKKLIAFYKNLCING